MKKIFKIILIVLVSAFVSSQLIHVVDTHSSASAEEQSPTYLISPSTMVADNNSLYVVDESNSHLIQFVNGERRAEIEIPNIKKMVLTDNNIFVLSNTTIYYLNLDLTSKLEISFPQAYPVANIRDFSVSDNLLYILQSDGDIDTLTLTGSVASAPSTLSKSYLEHLNSDSVILTGLDYIDGKITLNSSTTVYQVNPSNQHVDIKLSLAEGENIAYKSTNYVITTNNKLIGIDNTVEIKLTEDVSGLTNVGDNIFISSSKTHKIFKVNPSNGILTDLRLNPEIQINMLDKNAFIHLKVLAKTDLFYKPYSISKTASIESGTKLTVVGTIENFYYCLYQNGETNKFLFLNKNISNFEVLDIQSGHLIFTATRTSKIYSLPTTIEDSTNLVLGTISASQKIESENLITIENSAGELFFLVKHNNEYGFIRSNFLQSTKGAVELTNPCDAKVKRETIMFENSDGTGEIISLKKGTRIALLEEISPTKNYCLVEFQDTDGIIYSGYIFTEDIDPDGLSTLQILGLILVGTNLLLLSTILLIKKRSRKWKVAQPEIKNNIQIKED